MTKRIAAIGLAAMMSGCMLANPETLNVFSDAFAVTASAATASGTCGTNLRWSLSGDTLTITGSGTTMTNYGANSNKAPWRAYASQIKKVIFPKTIKSIGSYAFYNMTALEYVYTATGSYNAPTFPDCTYIGQYAFAECTKFRGNTQNGKLTFGTGDASLMQSGTIRICDSAFQNCDQVRFLYCNFSSMYVENWGFYNMNMLSTVHFEDTTVELCRRAFQACNSLANVYYKPSALTIHNEAFLGTSYYNNKCTNRDYSARNFGAASKLAGKVLVVNFFVDRTRVNLKGSNTGIVESYDFRKSNGKINLTSGQIATSLPVRYDSTSSTVGVFNKSQMTCRYENAWNPVRGTKTNNSVRTLNELDYTNLSNKDAIPLNTVQNGKTSGYLGSYVSSTLMTQRLNEVREAMNDLKTQAQEYGSSFTYEMHPETNFQITYDTFNWETTPAEFMGHELGYMMTAGYSGSDGAITAGNAYGSGNTYINDDPDSVLHQAIKTASGKLTGEYAHPIDRKLNEGNSVSNYTYYLKSVYHVDQVIYLFHVNGESQSYTQQTYNLSDPDDFKLINRMDEYCVICSKTGTNSGSIISEHEIAHLFGPGDYYKLKENTPEGQYVSNFAGQGELMTCTGRKVSPLTAFGLGWLDKLDSATYSTFFG